jgi:hypothetical protein
LAAGPAEGEEAIYRAVGFTGPHRLEVPGRAVDHTVEQIAA